MKKYDTIIWDMDGTLIDSLEDLMDSVNEALTDFGLPVRTISEIRSFVGNGVTRLVELSVPEGMRYPQFEEILLSFKKHYSQNCNNKTKPYKGLESVLPELKRRGYGMAIVSNKIDPAVKELAKLFFSDTIDLAIGESEGLKRKPDPAMVFEAIRQLNAKKESAVYIGDSETDIATAENAGIDCISVSWGFRDEKTLNAAGAKLIVSSPEELLNILE